jgi:hypothetical protein
MVSELDDSTRTDGATMLQIQRDIHSLEHQMGHLSEIKKQMDALTATMNALLQEKTMRSDIEERKQFENYYEGESSEGGRPYQHRFNRMNFPRFDALPSNPIF